MDIREFVRPLLGKKGAELSITHARHEKDDGQKHTVVEYRPDEAQLNRAAINIDQSLLAPALPPLASIYSLPGMSGSDDVESLSRLRSSSLRSSIFLRTDECSARGPENRDDGSLTIRFLTDDPVGCS